MRYQGVTHVPLVLRTSLATYMVASCTNTLAFYFRVCVAVHNQEEEEVGFHSVKEQNHSVFKWLYTAE
jgi:hypothetical protein